jgi:DNA-directed RNA polymerase subunit M
MMFCPRCGGIILPDLEKKGIKCSKCNYRETKNKSMVVKEKVNNKEKIKIIDKNIETLPKTQVECPKCKNNQAYYWLVQTRASDEPETQFFRCTKCDHQWRNY